MQNEKLNSIYEQALKDIESASNSEELLNVKNKYLAKKSELMGMSSLLGSLPVEENRLFLKDTITSSVILSTRSRSL